MFLYLYTIPHMYVFMYNICVFKRGIDDNKQERERKRERVTL